MIRRLSILLFLTLFVAECSYSQISEKDNQLRNLIQQFGQAEVTIPYPGFKAIDLITRNVSVTSVRERSVFITLSPLTVNWFLSCNFDYTILKRADSKGISSAVNLKQALEWDSYPTYGQYDTIMQNFSSTYPLLCHLDTIGTSVNGRLVLVLKISDNAGSDENEPEVFYSSTMHGNELAGYVLMLRLADYLLKNYTISGRVKNLVDNLEIWINPLANPDGTYTSGNTITSPVRSNANGVDLNRNFPDPVDPSIIPQKETVDMIKFMRGHSFVLSANFHSGAEVINYPWDRWFSKYHADDSWFYSISRSYADTVHIYSGPAYMNDEDNGVTRGAAWYVIYGGRQDFITYELQGREVTIEIDDILVTPVAQLNLLWQYNWRSLLGYLENSLYGIHGLVRDSHTLGPVPAKVFISGFDKDSSHIYSDTISGRFIRLLAPGMWNLTFSANGYRDTIINNVIVTPYQRNDLIVDMKSVTSNIEIPNPELPMLFPNPASSLIRAKLPDMISGPINIRIFNQAGMKVADYNTETLFGYPVTIDIRELSGGTYTVVFTNTKSGMTCRSRFMVIGRSF